MTATLAPVSPSAASASNAGSSGTTANPEPRETEATPKQTKRKALRALSTAPTALIDMAQQNENSDPNLKIAANHSPVGSNQSAFCDPERDPLQPAQNKMPARSKSKHLAQISAVTISRSPSFECEEEERSLEQSVAKRDEELSRKTLIQLKRVLPRSTAKPKPVQQKVVTKPAAKEAKGKNTKRRGRNRGRKQHGGGQKGDGITIEELKRLTALRLANLPPNEIAPHDAKQPTPVQSEFVARAWIAAHEYFSYQQQHHHFQQQQQQQQYNEDQYYQDEYDALQEQYELEFGGDGEDDQEGIIDIDKEREDAHLDAKAVYDASGTAHYHYY